MCPVLALVATPARALDDEGAPSAEEYEAIVAATEAAVLTRTAMPDRHRYEVRYLQIEAGDVTFDEVVASLAELPTTPSPKAAPDGDGMPVLEALASRLSARAAGRSTTGSDPSESPAPFTVRWMTSDEVTAGGGRTLIARRMTAPGPPSSSSFRLFADGLELAYAGYPSHSMEIFPRRQPVHAPDAREELGFVPLFWPHPRQKYRIRARGPGYFDISVAVGSASESDSRVVRRIALDSAMGPRITLSLSPDERTVRRLIWRSGTGGPAVWMSLSHSQSPPSNDGHALILIHQYSSYLPMHGDGEPPRIHPAPSANVTDRRVLPPETWAASEATRWPAELVEYVHVPRSSTRRVAPAATAPRRDHRWLLLAGALLAAGGVWVGVRARSGGRAGRSADVDHSDR